MNETNHWLDILERNGCRITAPRRVIVETLLNSPRALEPVEIYDLARKSNPGIGLVTVYRTLETLEAFGLIQRIHCEDGCHMVMPAVDGHQHYLVCTNCGKTICFQGDDLGALFARVESNTGYQVSDHWLQLFGTCPECRSEHTNAL